jgi:acetyl-CoA synthetase
LSGKSGLWITPSNQQEFQVSDLLGRFLKRRDFDSYEDFVDNYYDNFSPNVPEGFNFAYDVVDELARRKAGETAMVWCDEAGAEASFSYADMKRLSDKAANVLRAAGIGRGDPVMLILKRRHEYWPVLLALHKLGAVAIPATHLLTSKDIAYRCGAADVAGIICVDDQRVMAQVDEAEAKLKEKAGGGGKVFLRYKAFARSVHSPSEGPEAGGWEDFNARSREAEDRFIRPESANSNDDTMLLYFTSGTTGMPKMVRHNFAYPLGHILTARYWQGAEEGGLHFTVADTGWAKAAWGKIYGQWICGSAIFVYDYDRFSASGMLQVISKHRVTSFCAPPTVYRFFVKEDLSRYDFSALRHCAVAGNP